MSAAAAGLAAGDFSSAELTEAHLERIGRVDGAVRAFLAVTADIAREQARRADERIGAGEEGPLLGVPYGLKDLFTTRGITTTAGSRTLSGYVPPDSSTVYQRLHAAGAVLLGKLNMDEFAMGSSTEHSAFFPTRNPWDLERVPGGSSGGSTAAVAARLCPFSVATDTGGSIRQPAALCGVVGLKPTYGRVSRAGMIAFASSLDQAGPVTRTVRDAAMIVEVIGGHDPADATSLAAPVGGLVDALDDDWTPPRIGVPEEYVADGLDPGVRAAVESGISVLESLGATCESVSLPHTRHGVATYYILAPAEASANLARYDGLRYGHNVDEGTLWSRIAANRGSGFGAEVKRRIMIGTYVLSAGYHDRFYGEATRVRGHIADDLNRVFSKFDLVAGATTPTTAFRLGEHEGDPLAMYMTDVFTVGASLAGCPAITVPTGTADGLPVGLQLIGPPGTEARLLAAAAAFEAAAPWEHHMPPEMEP